VDDHSPPTERVARLLDLLAAHPGERFTLSELARGLEASPATVLRVANTLSRSGHLTRDAGDKTYALGPALVRVGRAAEAGFASVAVAKPLLAELSDRFGFACTASAVVGDDITVLARTGPPTDFDPTIRVGQRYPYAPPSGLMYALWDGDRAVDEWLARKPLVAVGHDPGRLRSLIESCRTRGYLVERHTDAVVAMNRLFAGLAGLTEGRVPDSVVEAVGELVSTIGERDHITTELGAGERFSVHTVCAPTYDADGRRDLILSLGVFRHDVAYEDVERYGTALVEACEAVTHGMGGRDPWLVDRTTRRSGRAR
jgi:DNA-binding IclR family transcriptional regulator